MLCPITKGQILYDSTYMKYLEQANLQRQEIDKRLPEVEEGGNGELVLTGYRVSVWSDEKVLEIDSGDGCTTL